MIWRTKRSKSTKARGSSDAVKRRAHAPEKLESRQMMAADPIRVGLVYLETDYLGTDQDTGGDSSPDRFILSFTGGALNTELTTVRINTDKDRDGLGIGDLIFDTAPGGRGKDLSHGFKVAQLTTSGGRQANVVAEVVDGGTELVLRLTNFRAGDRLEFTLDVDQILRMPAELDAFNRSLDVIASGQEFEDSILETTFTAPHYEVATAQEVFINDYGDPRASLGLNLPADDSGEIDSRPNRSAAAVASTVQTPKPISISGHVWVDNNLNKVREQDETLLAGVSIALWRRDASGKYIDTGHRTTTNASGYYEFAKSLGLGPGTYRVVETQPSGLLSVAAVPGSVSSSATGRAESLDILTDIHVPLGDTSAINFDFAEAQPSSLSGHVYRDDNDNGIRDAGEIGLGGVRVRLVPIDTLVSQQPVVVTTSADGSYQFVNLSPGRYDVVELDQPANLADGRDAAGTINGVRVGIADEPGDAIRQITLAGGVVGINYDFGELPLGSLAGFVYLLAPGMDCNGIRESEGNTPLEGVRLVLDSQSGQFIAETFTDPSGAYSFGQLPKGVYQIREFTPVGLLDGRAMTGRMRSVVVGESVGGGLIQSISMVAGGVGTEYNFCEASPASVSGVVYYDASNDGVRDANEIGIGQTQLSLVDNAGNVVATTMTDANGRYEFKNVLPGEYTIRETQPAGYWDGIDTPGSVRGTTVGRSGSDGDSLIEIQLKQGDVGVQYNFGELLGASLAGQVFVDLDEDCVRDPNELPLAGVKIEIFDRSGTLVAETTSDANGQYKFENLQPGEYSVVETQPVGYFEGGAKPGSAGGVTAGPNRIGTIILASGEVAVDYDFCERPPAEISGVVFYDRNRDSQFGAGESPIGDVRVELYNGSGNLVATAQTNTDGSYRFSNLPAGSYTVREIQPIGWLQGGQKAGSAGGDDSTQDEISRVPIGWGDRLTQYNFFELAPSSIAGTVYVDIDVDNTRDADEPTLAGVVIELRNAAGQVVATTTTDANGRYKFGLLAPGEYQVFEHQPDGYFQGGQSLGSGGGQILGRDLMGFQLTAGSDLVDYDFGELLPSSIAGIVYVDLSHDCVRDADEPPLEGVLIELRDGDGNVLATTRTNASGEYKFEGLAPGEYVIFEQQPDGYFQGGQVVGTGGGRVLGDDLLGLELPAGVNVTDYDFCELPPASISGRVWQETDLNRDFNNGDVPIAGVLVELLNESNQVISQTRTNSLGLYHFDGLAPGIYAVRETQPTGLFHGGQVAGSVGGNTDVDDLISNISLVGGAVAAEYNFPEVPPATISGYVFQDGSAIERDEAPDPKDLRDFKDGILTEDDKRIGQVILELRNVLGEPFTADRALPGVYQDGVIRVVTDANGYYEFTGLRPGTYSVYQIQPTDFIDGLDVAGSTGGVAVNAADELDDDTLIRIQTLAASELTDPRFDAILSISLVASGESLSNNFSEILVVQPPTLIPLTPVTKPEIPRVYTPIETFNNPIRLVAYSSPLTLRTPMQADDEWAVAWHLSVINGGFPNGDADDDSLAKLASSQQSQEAWDDAERTGGRWSLVDRRGNRLSKSNSMRLGQDGARALAGDFDGDGIDEAVLFVGGLWYVDFNGNGLWDDGDLWIRLGTELDRPVIGDWDGDGKDDIAIFGREWQRDSQRIKRDPGLPDPANMRRRDVNSFQLVGKEDRGEDRHRLMKRGNDGALRADAVDHVFKYGEQVDTPLAGDWNGDGIDQIAVFRNGQWLLDMDGDGRWTADDLKVDFGRPSDEPIAGDFNGDGIDEIGVIRGDMWIIDTDGDRRLTGNDLQISVPRSSDNSQPVVGDWDGDGRDEPGYYDYGT